ncbi:ribosome maturation factor RimP [Lactobacillus sp. CBA3605]|uniref:ribosome maturation factor RimP n=1 Tax=Lactobacillus sp. CBA3605 TaxID=2099788 RepID=UPI000CFBD722|nr:ribosome maturation factor RimP [Lactobacillus sp. CBA3605]AVK60498.1 ribosome maturation factor RimP [Lactobacillus sp. CBA3605]
MSNTVVETIQPLAQTIVTAHQFELVDVEFVRESQSWYLRIYIDKPGGINIEECAMVSDELSEKLDTIDPDPIPQAYFLEVSSPGAERPLKKEADYEMAIGQYVHVGLYQKLDGKKIFEGDLKAVTPTTLTIDYLDKTRHKTITIDRQQIAQARLAVKF